MFEDLFQVKKKDIFDLTLFSHKNEAELQKIFNVLIFKFFLDFTENKSTYIPNLGNFKFIFEGDEIVGMKKKAIIKCEFKADDKFSKLIGEFIDDSETSIEKYFKEKIEEILKEKIQDN